MDPFAGMTNKSIFANMFLCSSDAIYTSGHIFSFDVNLAVQKTPIFVTSENPVSYCH